jgi:hypothetical protein
MQSAVIVVSVRFLAAQSVVEIIWEGVQLYGYASIGQARDYLKFENFNDFFWAVLPSYLWYDPQSLDRYGHPATEMGIAS